MKKLLFTLAILCSTIGFGQVQTHSATIVTHYTTIETMVWSELNDEWVYIPNIKRHRRSSNWSITLKSDGSGIISMEDLKDGDNYYLEVYSWRAEDIKGKNGIVADFVQRIDGQKGTIIMQWENGMYGISVFLPQERAYLFFDNMN